jgi:hypothetical protein
LRLEFLSKFLEKPKNIDWNSNREFMQMTRERNEISLRRKFMEYLFGWVASDDEKLAEEERNPQNLSCLAFFFLAETFTSLQTFLSMSPSRTAKESSRGDPAMCPCHVRINRAFLLVFWRRQKNHKNYKQEKITRISPTVDPLWQRNPISLLLLASYSAADRDSHKRTCLATEKTKHHAIIWSNVTLCVRSCFDHNFVSELAAEARYGGINWKGNQNFVITKRAIGTGWDIDREVCDWSWYVSGRSEEELTKLPLKMRTKIHWSPKTLSNINSDPIFRH